jgi:hypothetical protein
MAGNTLNQIFANDIDSYCQKVAEDPAQVKKL